jgi:hypothetical protein
MKIDRRDLLLGSVALAVSAAARATSGGHDVRGDGFYLSSRNPIANVDQRDLEKLAIDLPSRPDIQSAIKRTADEWARVTDHSVSAEVWAMFPEHMANYCFRSILMAVNSDANFPKVLRVYSPAGHWMGNDVPASRWGAENPDNCYRIIPVAAGGQYVIRGQRQSVPSAYVSYQLVADTNTSITVGSLEQRDMAVAADGSFAITLDDAPANGRRNHIQLTADAMYLFVRDSLSDWKQIPDALRVERANPPARAPLSVDELASRATRIMHNGVAADYYWIRLMLNLPGQTLATPTMSGPSGGLVTQVSTSGHFELADDDAVIITLDPVTAAYHSLVLYDLWNRSLDYRNHQSHLNSATLVADVDGRTTCVVAIRDPGIRNWLDTTGLHEVTLGVRWQGIPGNTLVAPSIDTRVVKLDQLATAAPSGARKITPAERARDIAQRQQLFDRRFLDS